MVKKILIGIVVFLVLVVAALVAAPYLFKDKINAAVKEAINERVNATVDYTDYDLSLIHSFPNLSFGLNGLTVTGIGNFKTDTLLSIKSLKFTLDVMSVIKGAQYKILYVGLIEPQINAIKTKDGHANWDIMKPTPPSAPSTGGSTKFALQVNKYEIVNANIVYDDRQGATYAALKNFNFAGSGDVTQDLYKLVTKTSIASLTVKRGAVSYLSEAKLDANNTIDVDQVNHKYSFKENEIDLNDLGLLFDGFVQNNAKDMALDVTFKSKQAEFKSILSLIPAIFKKDFDKIKTSGSLALSGSVKGTYLADNMPAFKLDLQVANAMFQYPSLPTSVTNVNITAHVSKPQGGLDLTAVDIPKLHAEIGTDPIDAVISVRTPVSDPNLTANINGRLDLANVPKLYPVDGLNHISGLLVALINFKGKMSDVNKKNYQAINASGNLKVTDLVYDSKQTPMPVNVSALGLTFNPQKVSLDRFDAVLGKSDFNATGSLDNFVGYLFGKGNLGGYLTLKSNQFDANEWLTKDDKAAPAKPAAATAPAANTQYFPVPKGIDFTINSSFGKILYAKMTLSSVKGMLRVFDESIQLQNLSASLLGGTAVISALYNTKGTSKPKVTFSYDIKNFDMVQTYNAVGMAQKIAPVLKYLQGNFSSNLAGTGALKDDMSVDYNSLQGSGKVQIPSAKVVGLPLLQKIADVTKVSALNNLAITNASTVIKFSNGRVNVDPTDLKFGGGYALHFQGSNGFEESIDYDVRFDVPTKDMGGAAGLIGKLPQIPGLAFKMPETINISLKVGGTMAKPTVAISNIGSSGASGGNAATQAIDELKQKATDAAKQQADALKKQAQDAADKAAKQAADQLKNSTKGFKLPF